MPALSVWRNAWISSTSLMIGSWFSSAAIVLNCAEEVPYLCNCCGCCCEAMIAARRFALLHPVNTTNFLPEVEDAECTGCGKCVNICPVEAMVLISANDPRKPKEKKAKLREEICLGCGLCLGVCPGKHIKLKSRAQRVITPLNWGHLTVAMAIERGKLQNLIFDNHAHLSHRAMAVILGVILKLPPAKQAIANRLMKSRYLQAQLELQALRERGCEKDMSFQVESKYKRALTDVFGRMKKAYSDR